MPYLNHPAAKRVTDAGHAAWQPLRAAGLTPTIIEVALARYDEPHRIYHDRRHVLEMADRAVELRMPLTPPQALALLFHDAVYVPGAGDGYNETMSAQLLRVYSAGLDRRLIDTAVCIVLDTARHEPTFEASKLVLDLDLTRLAAPSDEFARHSREVFEELRPAIDELDDALAWRAFSARRAEFLQRLLRRPCVFHLAPFVACFEQAARANLARSIDAVSRPDSRETP